MYLEAVQFGFMSDEEVKKMSVKKITNSVLVDVMGQPMPNGLYDPALGPLDQLSLCKSCGLRMFHCLGHFGHIELVSLAYNPLLFDLLHKILQRTCFFCGHFRAESSQVEKCATRLELIMKGDIVSSKNLESISLDEFLHGEGSDSSQSLSSSEPSTPLTPKKLRNKGWTSVQFKEAMLVLNQFFKSKHTECQKCNAKNPTITKPVFGWIFTSGAPNLWRENVIRGRKLENAEEEGAMYGEVLDAVDMQQSPMESGLEAPSQKKGMSALDEYVKQKSFFSESLLPPQVKFVLKNLWENEARLCSFISDIHHVETEIHGNKEDYSMFFIQTLLVPPIKFRPPPTGGDFSMGHPQTILLTNVIEANVLLGNSHSKNLGPSIISRQWMYLQQNINSYFDKRHGLGNDLKVPGICQFLDKKEGIFRQKIMGKRVNFSCRSVISPDPYLAVNEIGIPPYFALRLTYPEKVTPWNVAKLREAIVNGSDIHPGATHYIDRLSTARLPPNRKNRIAVSRKLPSSRGAIPQTDKGFSDNEFQGKVVCRHLQDGDVVLVNRQPTLHKPSLMAHVVRVLKGEKTIRMHYANCSTYNADFDGDEINVHFPQDEISRSEGYNIVNANNQYIVPTRGDAKRGLIQDHVISAVLLTKKDTFLTREEFNQLVYSSGVSAFRSNYFREKSSRKISVVAAEDEVQIPIPAVFKPEPRWTGKQVISTVLNHLTRGRAPFTIEKDAKIPREYFMSNRKKKRRTNMPEDNKMLIYKNELVHGVIDQAQFGNKGLVHMVYELYGSNTAGLLLSAFSRLFTIYLQMHGFTCGVDDLLVLKSCDAEKKEKLEISENIGEKVHCQFIGVEDGKIDEMSLQTEIEKMVHRNGESSVACLDAMMISGLRQTVSDINRDLLHKGLSKPFPRNCVSLMTTSGAKGSMINFQQISSFLGQQELEGKRVPRMVSGKTLPCFSPWDCTPRAGGFITDSFLTGLRPQEYYFHCMAGREGLVDTAVKTSRSGYLQRCLIKSLEALKVCYDHTVRDSDSSIVQFCYGEDGVDVHQMNFLRDFKTMAANEETFSEKFGLNSGKLLKSGIDKDIEQLPFINGISKVKEMISMNSEEFLSTLPCSRRNNLLVLMKHKYFSSLAHPGEAVGVIAAQSVGEPSTQMTLNTFHLAGRGEMNVTLGIPRLQEILITASDKIRTPIMSCPLRAGMSGDDGKLIAARLRSVTVANIVEKMEVTVYPEISKNGQISSTYVLTMKLYDPKLYPPNIGISLDDCADTLETVFMREIEDAIQKNVSLSRRISGITNFNVSVRSAGPTDGAETDGGSDEDGGGDPREDDDTGSGRKERKQADDEVDYEDEADEEDENETSVSGITRELDMDDVVEDNEEEVNTRGDDEIIETPKGPTNGRRKRFVRKDTDRSFFVSVKGLRFEARFRFTDEPHILLAQIAEKVGERVQIKKKGNIWRCEVVESVGEGVGGGEDKVWTLQASGVDFGVFRGMEEEVDVRQVYSNSIHEMLEAYGVEAGRNSIVKEVKEVFNLYGVSVNVRHLNLIADYMTQHGRYQGVSRLGRVSDSVSPFTRMTFETASRFVLNAATRREIDLLDSPSARICMGLPVNMGTGCFDLLHKLD